MTATQRKLTTILSADVQGYSRLMQADEEGTLAALRQSRDAMGRVIEGRAGRVVNTWGDGLIAEFASVVEAVRAAVDIQNELAGHNAGRAPDRRMLYRIGINLGDVIVDGTDLLGDGVNIAARLQAQAEPGGIVISHTVYDQVRNKMPVGFDFLGNLEVKNLAEGVPSYAVRIGEAPASGPPPRDERAPPPHPGSPHPRSPRSLNARGAYLVLLAGILVAINLLSGSGSFWAKWPLLAFAVLAAMDRVRSLPPGWRSLAALAVAAIAIVTVNLFSWSGRFWAVWPLLGIAAAAGFAWLRNDGRRAPD